MVLAVIALSPSAFAQQKSAAACAAEWRANKAANQTAGKTEKAYVAECRSGTAPTATTPTAALAPTAAAPARPTPAKPAPTRTSATPAGADEFSTEAEAKARCPGANSVHSMGWDCSALVYHTIFLHFFVAHCHGLYKFLACTVGAILGISFP